MSSKSNSPADSMRLYKKASFESLSGANLTTSPLLSKKPSFNSLTSSQRSRLRESRAEAVFDQTTPFSTIRLMLARAAESGPDAPVPGHLYRQILEYFNTEDDDQMVALLEQSQKQHARPKLHSLENENQHDPSAVIDMDIMNLNSGDDNSVASGACTPATNTKAPKQLSNAEIMVYLSTMLGDVENLIPDGVFDDTLYVSDCEPCSDNSSLVDDASTGDAGERNYKLVGGTGAGDESDKEKTPRKIRREIDDDYDMEA
ncbi:hypothetical protein ABW21_db0208851 [Orbilia brochopaga]|nr:hypothetical protein ABW21_db0208851 [Drechslerella brochopaga]